MTKYCELAKTTTNCTENCKACLKEEAKTREIKVGDMVRYISEDSKEYKESGYFPPKGTIGIVIGIESIDCIASYHIRWSEGKTKGDGCWYVGPEDIEKV